MFSIHYDDRRKLLVSAREGFFDLEEAVRFRTTLLRAIAEAERARLPFDMLIDNSAGQPLANDVARYFQEIAVDIRASSARRIAFVSPGAVNRIQARRIIQADTDARVRVFENAPAAEAWLADPGTA